MRAKASPGMDEQAAALERLTRALERARKADTETAAARAELRAAVQAAHTAGVGVSELARRLGVSRTRVYALLDD